MNTHLIVQAANEEAKRLLELEKEKAAQQATADIVGELEAAADTFEENANEDDGTYPDYPEDQGQEKSNNSTQICLLLSFRKGTEIQKTHL